MNANEFFDSVQTELAKRGIPDDFSKAKLNQIKERISKLDENDAQKFYSEGNFAAVIDKICNSYESEIGSKDTIALTQTVEEVRSDNDSDAKTDETDNGRAKMTVVNPTNLPQKKKKETVISKITNSIPRADKRESIVMLVTIFIVFLPLIVALAVALLGVFSGVGVALAGTILLIIAVIFVVVLGGSVLSIASLLFGISQLFGDTKYIGFHEVGLGLFFVGATMLVGIALYNVAVRLIPFIYRLLGKLFVLICKLFKKWLASVMKGCEKL